MKSEKHCHQQQVVGHAKATATTCGTLGGIENNAVLGSDGFDDAGSLEFVR